MSERGNNENGGWSQSDEWRVIARRQALKNLAAIHSAPICGAKARSTGKPCRKPGLGRGGRCNLHGGRSGSGETWGLRQWRDSPSPVVARRMMTKAEHLEILDQERARRIAAMSPEERQRHEARQRSHAAGPAEARAGRKLMAAYQSSAPSPQDFTIAELEALIAELKAQKKRPRYQGVFE